MPSVAELAEVGDDQFDAEVLQSEGPVVVDFWAPWCGPCRVVGPILADMADEHQRVTFLKLNVDENPQTQARYSVLSIPTVILFDGGEARETVIGARSRSHYESVWDRWLRPAAWSAWRNVARCRGAMVVPRQGRRERS